MGTGKKIVLLVLIVMQSFCSQGLPKNIFDPETLIGLLVGLDPFRYNPPPKSKIKTQGLLSSISEGESFQLGVLLENNPYGAVDVSISSNVSSLSINGNKTTSLKFNTANYSVEQKITLTAGIDADANNELATITLTATGLDTQTVSVIIADDLAVTLTGTVTTIQEGQTASVGVKLSKKPPVNKTVTITSSNSAITMNGTSSQIIEFTPDNYNIPQTLNLLAVPDSNSTNEAVTLTFAMPGSLDLTYNLSVLDDNSIQVSSFPSALLEGTSQNIGVRFSKILLADNTITVTSNNPAITINGGTSATLNYTTTNGTADQTITLQSVIDANLASESVTLNFTANGMAPLILNIAATDKDIQNMVVTGAIPTLVEGTSSVAGNLQVQLTQDPGGTATITVTSSDTSTLTIDPATTFITFDSSNWNTPRNVNINAIEDVNETSETVSVIFNTPGAPLQIYNVITIDNDTRILIGGASNVNEGGANNVTVSLSGNPGIAKTINLVSSNISAATLSLATLTLTPSNYSQSVTISGVQDANILSETVTVTGTCAGLATGTRNITTVDDDVMNILLSSGTIINEGGTINLTVKLSQDPTTPMTVNLSSSLPGSVSVSPTSVSLTSANYNTTGVVVTLTGVEDANETSEIAVITASATAVTPVVQNITTVENDTKPMFSGATSVMEGNAGVMFVKLSGDPGTSRTVTLSSSLPAITLNPMLLSFDSSNWNNVQAVTVTGVVDANVISEVVTITGTGLITNTTVITAVDTNTMGIQITGNTTVAEAGTSTINVRLTQDPSTPLTVSLTSNTPASITVSPATLTFNSCNGAGCWDTTQTVTLTGIHDGNATTEPVTITATAGAISTTWNVNTQDDDAVAQFVGSPYLVNEEGVGFMQVQLTADPGATRVMTISSANTLKLNVITPALTFNSSNWNIPQAVTLSGVADDDVADETVTINTSGVNMANNSTTVTVKDNDVLDMIVTNVGGTTLTEGDGSNPIKYRMKLNYRPSSNVVVNFTSKDTSPITKVGYKIISSNVNHDAMSTSFSSITFTPAGNSYNTEQEISVYAVENLYIDNYNTQLYMNVTGGLTKALTYDLSVKDNDSIIHNLVDAGFGPTMEKPSVAFNGSGKILIAGTYTGSSRVTVPILSSCDLNGANCRIHGILDSFVPDYSGHWVTSLFIAPYWVVVAKNFQINKLTYFHVNANNNWDYPWSYIPIGENMGLGNNTADNPVAVVDSINNKVIVAANTGTGGVNNLSLFRFNHDGTVPENVNFNDRPYAMPNMVIDIPNQKIIVTSSSQGVSNEDWNLIMKRCDLTLNNCVNRNISIESGNPNVGMAYPYPILDTVSSPSKLLIVGKYTLSAAAGLFRCNIDGTGCSFLDVSVGQGSQSAAGIKGVIDTINKKLLMLTHNQSDNYALGLFRCNLDGTQCTYRNLSSWLNPNAGANPEPFIEENADPHKRRLRVVTENRGLGKTLSMFSMLLYID